METKNAIITGPVITPVGPNTTNPPTVEKEYQQIVHARTPAYQQGPQDHLYHQLIPACFSSMRTDLPYFGILPVHMEATLLLLHHKTWL
jgi:hypothetical protein